MRTFSLLLTSLMVRSSSLLRSYSDLSTVTVPVSTVTVPVFKKKNSEGDNTVD